MRFGSRQISRLDFFWQVCIQRTRFGVKRISRSGAVRSAIRIPSPYSITPFHWSDHHQILPEHAPIHSSHTVGVLGPQHKALRIARRFTGLHPLTPLPHLSNHLRSSPFSSHWIALISPVKMMYNTLGFGGGHPKGSESALARGS